MLTNEYLCVIIFAEMLYWLSNYYPKGQRNMKKRIVSAALAAFTMLGMAAAPAQGVITVYADGDGAGNSADIAVTQSAVQLEDLGADKTYGDFSYFEHPDYISITKYNGTDKNVTIPSKINGKPVKDIDDQSFGLTEIESVTIPEGVFRIGDQAFYECALLKTVNFPSTVKYIGVQAFWNTPWLENDLEKNQYVVVNKILISVSDKCVSGKKLDIPSKLGIEAIGSCVVYSNNGVIDIEEIVIPKGVTKICSRAFVNVPEVKKVSIPATVTIIGSYAFHNTEWFEKQIKTDELVIINNVLYSAPLYTKTAVTIPDNIVSISGSAFTNNQELTSVKIPSSVKDIGDWAFGNCHNLKTVTLSEGLEEVGAAAFKMDENLKSITIPASVKVLNNYAFGCYYTDEKGEFTLEDFKINCYKGTAGEDYAKRYGFKYNLVKSLNKATVKVANKTYTGKALKPAPTVTLGGKTLKKGTDYTVSYKNNKNCGMATVIVTGKGSYEGTKTGSFIIKPNKVTAKKLTSPKTKQVKLTWNKAAGGVDGYQILVGTNKGITAGKKTLWVKKAATTAKTVSGLKAKKTYYAKIRAYKTVGSKKYYGAWSAVKSVKTK